MNSKVGSLLRGVKHLFLGDVETAARDSEVHHEERIKDNYMSYESIRSILIIR